MIVIVAFVTISQVLVVFQILRLGATQTAILQHSVPLLDRTQNFARLMTITLSKTAQLDETLSIEELEKLRSQYLETKINADAVLAEIDLLFPDGGMTERFRLSLEKFSRVSEQLFENQLSQSVLE